MFLPKIFTRLAIFTVLAITSNVSAEGVEGTDSQPHVYAGVGAMMWIYADDYTRGMANGFGYHTRFGYQFNEYIALEARASGGGEGELGGVNMTLDNAVSALAVFSSKLDEQIRVGGYLGYTRAVTSYASTFYDYTLEYTDQSATVGSFVETGLNENFSLYADYGTYIFGSDFIFQEVSLGIVRRF